jgi:hypothetical protein
MNGGRRPVSGRVQHAAVNLPAGLERASAEVSVKGRSTPEQPITKDFHMHAVVKSILLGAMVLSASTTMTFAQRVAPPVIPIPPPPAGTPPTSGCTAICGDTSDTLPTLTVPFDRKGKSKPEIAKHLGCGDKLAALGDFRRDVLAAVAAPQTVRVVPVCPYIASLTSDEPLVLLHAIGNAQGLGKTLAANVLTEAALEKGGYRPADVVALGFAKGKETLILYVHKQ